MMPGMRRLSFFFVYWLPVLAWAGVIFTLSSIPSLGTGLPWVWDLILRKIGHAVEYSVLMYLIWRALSAQGWRGASLIGSAFLSLGYALGDEYHQSFVPGRMGSLRDVAVDGVGVLIALIYLSRRSLGKLLARGSPD